MRLHHQFRPARPSSPAATSIGATQGSTDWVCVLRRHAVFGHTSPNKRVRMPSDPKTFCTQPGHEGILNLGNTTSALGLQRIVLADFAILECNNRLKVISLRSLRVTWKSSDFELSDALECGPEVNRNESNRAAKRRFPPGIGFWHPSHRNHKSGCTCASLYIKDSAIIPGLGLA